MSTRAPNWSREDDATLMREYPETATKELAAKLGRTPNAVYLRARKLELEKSYRHLQGMAGSLASWRKRNEQSDLVRHTGNSHADACHHPHPAGV